VGGPARCAGWCFPGRWRGPQLGLGHGVGETISHNAADDSFTGWQLLLGGIPIIIGASLLEAGKLAPLSWQALAALAYNMAVASILCYWVWFKIVSRASATASALGTLSIPVVGVFSSILVLGERPEGREYLALLLVLAAIATVIIPPRAGTAMRQDITSSGRRSGVPHDPLGL